METLGRYRELDIFNQTLNSAKSELIVVYGRRRVGKTFLIRNSFEKRMKFEISGLHNGTTAEQIENFTKELRKKLNTDFKTPKNWLAAFSLLENYIDNLPKRGKKVIFIDEFPWIATQNSRFLTAFENFWNSYCTKRKDLIVVICGSAASYMVQKIIKNKGGLHNRISHKIRLLPFTLHETKLFLKYKNIDYTDYDILQIYMTFGGVPHYLEQLKIGKSVAQNIDQICFADDGILNDEFNQLYASLFIDSERHLALVKALSTVNKGLTRTSLSKKSGVSLGGDLSLKLMELIESGFVTKYSYYKNKTKKTMYRLSDEYSLFYLKFIEKQQNNGKGTWENIYNSQSYISWAGFSFETLCLKHINQLKKGLGIDRIYSLNSSWFNQNAQIDLLIDRDDNIINVCELKFHKTEFTITADYYSKLKTKISEFKTATKTKKNVHLTMITTYGVKPNKYSLEIVQNQLNMTCLFDE